MPSTGYPSVDRALGGVVTGDNVVWKCDDAGLYATLARAFAASNGPCLVVSFGEPRLRIPKAQWLDAGARSRFGRPGPLADQIELQVAQDPPSCLIVDHLARVARRWKPDAIDAFFARICPAMLQAGVTAYWGISDVLGRGFVEHVRQITQCLLEVRDERLVVVKAEGRPDALHGITYQLHTDGDEIRVSSRSAGGRLARGLVALREELGLSQLELARIAGVTPSAISQAESGRRGLSIDTLVTLADRLDISLDRLIRVGSRQPYRLARHDRSRRLAATDVIALASDATVGLRAHLIELGPGGAAEPPFEHHGVQWIGVSSGLVQVDLGNDRPVLRPGDSLLLDAGGVRGWQNLRRQPASVYWVVRD